MKNRVRFAPSPTGNVHIGNIRTAIFNWLFARHTGGEFLLRVEDTDRERSTQEAIDALLQCMSWLGLDFDEDIFYQSQHAEDHLAAADKLLNSNRAYRPAPKTPDEAVPVIFRMPWNTDNNPAVKVVGTTEIDVHAEVPVEISASGINYAQVSKKGKPVPATACLAGFHELKITDTNGNCCFELEKHVHDILAKEATFSLEKCAKFTFERREVFFEDIIKGRLAKPLDSMKDLVIVRSDGSPVFHLANVCDDATQNVTHIVRGDDHVENTYRHVFLFQALDLKVPQYAHMPMIVNTQGKPYSKRDGDAFVGDFREKGYLAKSLFNYLTLLGWSPGDDREKMTKQELIDAFALERVLSSPAQFDQQKLLNLNGQYLADMSSEDFAEYAWENACSRDWTFGADYVSFTKVAVLLQQRTKLISQIQEWELYFSEIPEYDPKAVRKQLKKEDSRAALASLIPALEALETFSIGAIEETVHLIEEENGLSQGKLNPALRVAVTGCTSGAGLFETIELLGKARCSQRINHALSLDIPDAQS